MNIPDLRICLSWQGFLSQDLVRSMKSDLQVTFLWGVLLLQGGFWALEAGEPSFELQELNVEAKTQIH